MCLGLVCYTSWVKRWSEAMDLLFLKSVHFTVSIILVVHNFPSVLIEKKHITSARSHELRFEPMSTTIE